MYMQTLYTYRSKFYSGFTLISMVLFIAIAFWGVIFWISRNKKYSKAYLPLMVSLVSIVMIALLPLKYIRLRTDLFLFRDSYERGANIALKTKLNHQYKLPEKYQYFSRCIGDVSVHKDTSVQAVFFSTYSLFGGSSALMRINKLNNKQNKRFKMSFNDVDEFRWIDGNWYYATFY